ncbi:MAG TPA: 5-deoxy-glucuronate isomerase [Sulfolobales archaeon]|nr:5-deoxy-glucuronate isomerase [Sulfolobales archaeon]
MLLRNPNIYDRLLHIFDYRGFSLYSYRASKRAELVLEPLEGRERTVASLGAWLRVNSETLGERDIAYIPMGARAEIEVDTGSVVYIAESMAMNRYQFYVKRFQQSDSYDVGVEPYRRRVYVTIGEKDPADSIIAGYVEGEKGNWTSYPPHRHDEKPEAYIFFGMGEGFGVQLIMDESGEYAYVVRDYDVVLIPRGYHPNVCTSLAGCKYLWIISAPIGKRDLSVTIHPAFKDIPMGRSHLKVK